jgi:Mg2+ and Co2+ transporter CorA
VNQLEITNTTISKAEWFSDDYQAKIDDNLSRQKWKADLVKINEIAKDINYMRRHLNHFWRAMYLNLERLGVQLGSESVDENASLALRGAQKDFITIHTRMQPLRDRAEALNSVSNDLSNLRAAFRGVADGEFSLRLSLFASVVFPLTLLAGIFSMGDDYRPGRPQFWKLWAIGVPFCVTVALGLVYGKRPWTVFIDLWRYIRTWAKRHEIFRSKIYEVIYKEEHTKNEGRNGAKSRSRAQDNSMKRAP